MPYRVARDPLVTSTGNEISWPANAGLTDSTVACKPPRFERVHGIETRKTLISANKSRYDAALFWLEAAYQIAARTKSRPAKLLVGARGNLLLGDPPCLMAPVRCSTEQRPTCDHFVRTAQYRVRADERSRRYPPLECLRAAPCRAHSSWPRPATHEAGPAPRAATNRCDGAVAKRPANPGDNRVAPTRYGSSALLLESRAMFPRQKPDSIP